MENCHEERMIPRTEEEKKQLITRLKRIEGQVRGIAGMIEEDRYCIDTITQILAVEAALKKVGFSLLQRHTEHCMQKAVRNGHEEEAVAELMNVIQRFTK
ncbi:MAG: metal-sensing transcriptional repressor [Bacilli bacterium]